jgi:hypothetical protein
VEILDFGPMKMLDYTTLTMTGAALGRLVQHAAAARAAWESSAGGIRERVL